jgi:hypothetical protein
MKSIFIIAILAALVTSEALAQETGLPPDDTQSELQKAGPVTEEENHDPTFSFSGSVDTYFRTAFGTTNPYASIASGNSSSFANVKGFGLGMANLIASYSGDKAGFTADLVFGPRGRDAVFGRTYAESEQRIINQMFVYYKMSDRVTLNLGQFNTFFGYEVISPALNFHYSTSYLFSYGPFSHTGLRADFNFANGVIAKIAVMNPTDILEFNDVNTFTVGGQIGKTSDNGGIWLNVLYGDQDGRLSKAEYVGEPQTSMGSTFQIDLTTGWNLTEKFFLGFNTSMQRTATGEVYDLSGEVRALEGDASSFFGVALYPKVALAETFSLGLRAEYFGVKRNHLSIFTNDADGGGRITAFTLTANYKVGALTIIPEVRMDQTSENSFSDSAGNLTDTMSSAILAAVYKF